MSLIIMSGKNLPRGAKREREREREEEEGREEGRERYCCSFSNSSRVRWVDEKDKESCGCG
jgi:hypothetical protein